MGIKKVLICAIVLASVLIMILSASAFGVSYFAGYEADNQWWQPYQNQGAFGIRADIWTPAAYPIEHQGTIKACVQVVWPNSMGQEWSARAGWKSEIGQQSAYSYLEGYDSRHYYIQIGFSAQPRHIPRAYEIKIATGGSNLYNIYIVGSFRAQVYLYNTSYEACAALTRASGLANDVRAKFESVSWLYAYPRQWEPMGRSGLDHKLSATYGGGHYWEWDIYQSMYACQNRVYGSYY